MRINRVRISGFRALYDLNFSPRPFTVLVGPNNAGKSTIVDAFDYLADVHRHGLEIATNRKGGFENIAHRRIRRTKRPITFEVCATAPLMDVMKASRAYRARARDVQHRLKEMPELSVEVLHRFEIKAASQKIAADFAVRSEAVNIRLYEASNELGHIFVTRHGDEINTTATPNEAIDDWLWQVVSEPLLTQPFIEHFQRRLTQTGLCGPLLTFNPVFDHFSERLQATRVYRLAPLECRRSGVPTPNAELNTHGSNLPALVWHMAHYHKPQWELVLMAMRRVVPGLMNINVEFSYDRRLILRFQEEGVGRPWTSEEISDGTIQSLALFCVIHDPRSQLVFVEEPENSLHPWILRHFVDVCHQLQNKQVVLTTHSAPLLDYLHPDEVSLVWRKQGRSELQPLVNFDPQLRMDWDRGNRTVFEFLDSGEWPDSVPGGN